MLSKLKKVRLMDIVDLVKIVVTFFPGIVLSKIKPDIVIVSERPGEARDNGYWIFKYINENNPSFSCYYAIQSSSKDYYKVKDIGKTLEFGSLKHHTYFWACKLHVSAHIGNGLPSHRVGFNLLKAGIYGTKSLFLQHGIVKHQLPFLKKSYTGLDYLTATTTSERNYLVKEFDYTEDQVFTTGMARYDNLNDTSEGKTILLMPTWRIWLAHLPHETIQESRNRFLKSEYYQTYHNLINDKSLINILESNNLSLIFYLHSDMQIYSEHFSSESKSIIIADQSDFEVQTLLNSSDLLITDYSSVSYDFAYLGKPIIFYKFDKNTYYREQYPIGNWIGGKDENFGSIALNHDQILKQIFELIYSDFDNKKHDSFSNDFFTYRDTHNCKRVFELINKIGDF